MTDPRNMTFNELKTWLSDRLQRRGGAPIDIDMRRDEAPYEQPVKLWKAGNDGFRNNFKRAVTDLVAEAGAKPWDPPHFHELGLLVEAADLWEAVRPLEGIASSGRLLQHSQGAQLHMLALRTLLALQWKGTLDFWLAQKKVVGARWPAIVFEGLSKQDVDLAFAHLPGLVTSRNTMRDLLNLFPGLMRELKLGISHLREKCRNVVAELPPDAAAAMREWFRLRDYPLAGSWPEELRLLGSNSSNEERAFVAARLAQKACDPYWPCREDAIHVLRTIASDPNCDTMVLASSLGSLAEFSSEEAASLAWSIATDKRRPPYARRAAILTLAKTGGQGAWLRSLASSPQDTDVQFTALLALNSASHRMTVGEKAEARRWFAEYSRQPGIDRELKECALQFATAP